MKRLSIVIEVADERQNLLLAAVAVRAAMDAGGELRSAYVEEPSSGNALIRALGLGLHTRTELYPISPITVSDLLAKDKAA